MAKRALSLLTAGLALLAPSAGASTPPLKVGLITDLLTKPGTHDFRALEYLGFDRALRDFRVQGRVIQINPTQGAEHALRLLGRERYDLVYTGLASPEDVDAVARVFPRTRFLFPFPYAELKSKPPNVQGEDFRIEQAGYLAGYLAALMEKQRVGRDVVGSVGGFPFPGVDWWIAGYEAGARRADPGITILRRYSHDYLDPAKCRRVAESEIAAGAGVVFQVAGACGLGTLEAAREHGVWGVGVDGDESYLGPHILTSAIARFDRGIYRGIEALVEGRFRTGGDARYDLANGGVGLGRISAYVPRRFLRQLAAIRAQIASGRIRVPTTLSRR